MKPKLFACLTYHYRLEIIFCNVGETTIWEQYMTKSQYRVRFIHLEAKLIGDSDAWGESGSRGGCVWMMQQQKRLQCSGRGPLDKPRAVLCLSGWAKSHSSAVFHLLSSCTWTVQFCLCHKSVMLHSTTHTHISTYLYTTCQTEIFIAIMQLFCLLAINFSEPIYKPWEQGSTLLVFSFWM